jgi:hypothetical protein
LTLVLLPAIADFEKLITPKTKAIPFVIQETQRLFVFKEEMMQLAELVKNTICFNC